MTVGMAFALGKIIEAGIIFDRCEIAHAQTSPGKSALVQSITMRSAASRWNGECDWINESRN